MKKAAVGTTMYIFSKTLTGSNVTEPLVWTDTTSAFLLPFILSKMSVKVAGKTYKKGNIDLYFVIKRTIVLNKNYKKNKPIK